MKPFLLPAKRQSMESTKAAMAHAKGNSAVKRMLSTASTPKVCDISQLIGSQQEYGSNE
jgi:hypothetical protein